MSAPFKMKAGSSPMKHLFGKHPSKKDGHVRADHKKRKAMKKAGKAAGKSFYETAKFVAGLAQGRKKGSIPKAGDFVKDMRPTKEIKAKKPLKE